MVKRMVNELIKCKKKKIRPFPAAGIVHTPNMDSPATRAPRDFDDSNVFRFN